MVVLDLPFPGRFSPSLHARVRGSTEWVCTHEPVTCRRRANTRVQTRPRDFRRERRQAGRTPPLCCGTLTLCTRMVEGYTPRPPPRRPARHALGSMLAPSRQPPSDTSQPVHISAELPISLPLSSLCCRHPCVLVGSQQPPLSGRQSGPAAAAPAALPQVPTQHRALCGAFVALNLARSACPPAKASPGQPSLAALHQYKNELERGGSATGDGGASACTRPTCPIGLHTGGGLAVLPRGARSALERRRPPAT